MSEFKPVRVRVNEHGQNVMPACMQNSPEYYQVQPANENGSVFICTRPDYNGHVCTFLSEDDVTVVG